MTMSVGATILVAKTAFEIRKIAVKTVDKTMDIRNGMVERECEWERVKVEGQIARDILSAETENEINSKKRKIESMKAEGEYKINLLNEKGNIKIKKIESDYERKKDENNHIKEMAKIEKNQIKEMKKIQNEHERNLLKQKNESKKINVEIDKNIINK